MTKLRDTLYCHSLNCGRGSMVELELPKLTTRVRFPSPAPQDSLTALIPFGIRAVFISAPSDGNRTRQGAELRNTDWFGLCEYRFRRVSQLCFLLTNKNRVVRSHGSLFMIKDAGLGSPASILVFDSVKLLCK